MYVWLYPRLSINATKQTPFYIKLPMAAFVLSFMILGFTALSFHYPDHQWIYFGLICTIILLIPYFVIVRLRKRQERKIRILLVICAAFIIAFFTTPALNYLATFNLPVHDEVQVIDKKISTGRFSSHYLIVQIGEENLRMNVSSSLYESTNISDTVLLCRRTSIFGVQYWTLHK